MKPRAIVVMAAGESEVRMLHPSPELVELLEWAAGRQVQLAFGKELAPQPAEYPNDWVTLDDFAASGAGVSRDTLMWQFHRRHKLGLEQCFSQPGGSRSRIYVDRIGYFEQGVAAGKQRDRDRAEDSKQRARTRRRRSSKPFDLRAAMGASS